MEEAILISAKEAREKIESLNQPNNVACIILGAGASYGYSSKHIYKPPIVKDLFDPSNRAVDAVINHKDHTFINANAGDFERAIRNHGGDLERYLSDLYSRDRNDNRFNKILRYLEDIFFLTSKDIVMGEPNNYKALINRMWDLHGGKKWSLLSFNYDTILEKSYLMADRDITGRAFVTFDQYTRLNPVILKMHGGINFRYILRQPFFETGSGKLTLHDLFSQMMTDVRPTNQFIRLINLIEEKPDLRGDISLRKGEKLEKFYEYNFPLMQIPIHASISHENTFFQENLKLAEEQIKNASLIIGIGYSFGDEAFLNVMSKIDFSKKEIILINSADSIRDLGKHAGLLQIKANLPEARVRVFDGGGFDEFIDAIC